jgi:hypothetical protein
MRSRFDIVRVENGEVYLQDLDGPVSITNDAEQVLAWCKTNYPNHRLFYTDTYGDLTEIVGEPHTTWMGTSPVTFKSVG